MQITTPLLRRSPAEERTDDHLVRVYVWQLPVRLAHWAIVLSMVVLAFTGWYLHGPFIGTVSEQAWIMAIMRQVHLVTAFVFTAAVLARLYWFFVGNRWSSWRAFVPVRARDFTGIGQMLKYYLFLRWRAPKEVGHNRLAALAYLAIYGLMVVQVITGFGLYGWIGTQPWATLFSWVPRVLPIQYIREIHYLLMFIFAAFMVHHVYSSLLVSAEEKNGLMGSIFSGHKFIRRSELEDDLAGWEGEPRGRTYRVRPDGRVRERRRSAAVPTTNGKIAPGPNGKGQGA